MLNNITIGQFFPGNSLLHRMDPRAKIIGTTIFVVAIFLALIHHWRMVLWRLLPLEPCYYLVCHYV